jgi:hypothetical protein
MDTGIVVFIGVGLAGFALLLASTRWRSGYIGDLNKKLSTLLDNPEIMPNYRGASIVSGTYKNHTIDLEWSPPQYNRQMVLLLNAKIYDLDILALEKNYRSDIVTTQSDTAKLWKEISNLRSVKQINFSNHVLRVEMQWFAALVDEKTGTLLAGTIADAWANINPEHVVQEVGITLDKVFKILELLS